MNQIEKFREKLESGAPVFGPFMKTGDPAFVEIVGFAGFDFAVLDMEHGPVSFENLQNLIRGSLVAGMMPIVRTPDSRPIHIGKALDLGAGGVMVPQVSNAIEAREVVSSARFFPEGNRGMCRYVRAANYSSKPPKQYFKDANTALVIIQVEGEEALNNLDEILEVEGIDILFIGPYDLSQSFGYPGETDHPKVIEAMKSIVGKSAAKGMMVGTFTDSLDAVRRWKAAGVCFLSYSVDMGIFTLACKDLVSKISEL